MSTTKIYSGNKLAAVIGLGTALLAINGCANADRLAYTGALDRQTCNRLLAHGIDCKNDHFLVSDARAHVEYFQQALPIHERWDVVNGEIEAWEREK